MTAEVISYTSVQNYRLAKLHQEAADTEEDPHMADWHRRRGQLLQERASGGRQPSAPPGPLPQPQQTLQLG